VIVFPAATTILLIRLPTASYVKVMAAEELVVVSSFPYMLQVVVP
jgi:hypothetical protein